MFGLGVKSGLDDTLAEWTCDSEYAASNQPVRGCHVNGPTSKNCLTVEGRPKTVTTSAIVTRPRVIARNILGSLYRDLTPYTNILGRHLILGPFTQPSFITFQCSSSEPRSYPDRGNLAWLNACTACNTTQYRRGPLYCFNINFSCFLFEYMP